MKIEFVFFLNCFSNHSFYHHKSYSTKNTSSDLTSDSTSDSTSESIKNESIKNESIKNESTTTRVDYISKDNSIWDKYFMGEYNETIFVDNGFGGKSKEIVYFIYNNEEMIEDITSFDKNKSFLYYEWCSNNPDDFPIINWKLNLINFVNDTIFSLDDRDVWLKENLLYYWREFQKKDFHTALNDPTLQYGSSIDFDGFNTSHYSYNTKTIFKNTSVPLEHIELYFCKRLFCLSVFYGLKSHLHRNMEYHLVTVRQLSINDIVYDIGLVYYKAFSQYKFDVLLPRSLELFSKSELKKHLEVFCTQQSVFSQKCLRFASFSNPLEVTFQRLKHPKYKDHRNEHEYYLGLPVQDDEVINEEYEKYDELRVSIFDEFPDRT